MQTVACTASGKDKEGFGSPSFIANAIVIAVHKHTPSGIFGGKIMSIPDYITIGTQIDADHWAHEFSPEDIFILGVPVMNWKDDKWGNSVEEVL